MKALNPEFQSLLDDGESLKERILSYINERALIEDSETPEGEGGEVAEAKRSFKIELRGWFNSVANQTKGLSYFGATSLDGFLTGSESDVEFENAKSLAANCESALEIVAAIPFDNSKAVSVQTAVLDMTRQAAYER